MQERFYILKPAVDTEETGHVFPAVESYDNYNFDAPNSVHKIKSREFPDFEPDIRFKLAKGAKLCDMMGQATISAPGFLISERLKDFFEGVNSVPKKFYPATIEANGGFHLYYWMHLVWVEAVDFINFEQSKFKVKEFSNDLGEIEISSYRDLMKKQGELGFMKMIHNYKTSLKNPKFDLFLHGINFTVYVKDNINQVLKKYSGINLEQANNLDIII